MTDNSTQFAALKKQPIIKADLNEPSEMNTSSKFDINYLWIGLLMIAVLLRFPWVLIYDMHEVQYRPVIQLVTHAGVGMVAVAILLCNLHWFKERFGWFRIGLISLILISTGLHVLFRQEVAIFEMVALVAVPLVCALNYRIVMNLLPWYVGLFWLANTLETFEYFKWFYSAPQFANAPFDVIVRDWWTNYNDAVGMPGNRNWQGCFVTATTPFAMWSLWQIMKFIFGASKKWIPVFIIFQIPILLASFIIFVACDSRGAFLSFCVGMALMVFLFVIREFRWDPLQQKRLVIKILCSGIAVLLIGFAVFNKEICYRAEKLNITDVRVPMWTAATRMIFETQEEVPRPAVYTPRGYRWLLGGGCEYFEDQFVSYRAANYFCRPMPASRTDYPHNFTFYTLGAMGIPAGIAFVILVISSLVIVYRRLMYMKELDVKLAVLTWMCFIFYMHTQLDLILEYWPMCGFFLIGLGCLWYRSFKTYPVPNVESISNSIAHNNSNMLMIRFVGLALGIGMFAWAIQVAYTEAKFHGHERYAMMYIDASKDPSIDKVTRYRLLVAADKEYEKALSYKPVMEVAYLALTNSTWSALNLEYKMDKYLSYIKNEAKRFNYCNVPQIAAFRAYEKKDFAEYEKQIKHQTEVYPIGTSYWITYYDFLKAIGKNEEAADALECIKYTLELKGFEPTTENIDRFRGDPGFDLTGKGPQYIDRKIAQLQLEYFGHADSNLLKNPIPWPSMHNPIVPPSLKAKYETVAKQKSEVSSPMIEKKGKKEHNFPVSTDTEATSDEDEQGEDSSHVS